ncbi:MAG: GNAT family N-acetyltransferase [Pseudomonadota bacterium]
MAACQTELATTPADIKDPKQQYAVAHIAEALVGFYGLITLSTTIVELDALFVEPDSIGQGIGRALITHAIDAAGAQGHVTMRIQGDPHASRFYEAAGAVRVGQRESGSVPGRWLPEYELAIPIAARRSS